MHNKYWRIEAFFWKNGKYELQEFVTGLAHKQAGDYFRRHEFAKITMKPVEEDL